MDGAICRPLPLQDGGVPLWIAGSGEKKTLRIAARYARYTNFASSPGEFQRKSAILREHCAAEGVANGALVGTPEQIAERLDELAGLGMSYAIFYLPGLAYDRSGLNLLTEKVIPAFRDLPICRAYPLG